MLSWVNPRAGCSFFDFVRSSVKKKEVEMKAYSEDLREKVVLAHQEEGGSSKKAAKRMFISVASVNRYVRQKKTDGHVQPKSTKRGPAPVFDEEKLLLLSGLVQAHPDATLAELGSTLSQDHGICVHASTLTRALQKLGLSRKKKPSSERTRPKRRARKATTVLSFACRGRTFGHLRPR